MMEVVNQENQRLSQDRSQKRGSNSHQHGSGISKLGADVDPPKGVHGNGQVHEGSLEGSPGRCR